MCRTVYDNFKSEHIRYDMFYEGDTPKYPKHARKAFDILVERARNRAEPIGYNELADRLCISPYPSRGIYIGKWVLPCISTKLYQLEQRTGEKLPRLTNIVFSYDALSNPDNYIVRRYYDLHGSRLTWTDYVNRLLAPIHAYEEWDLVLNQIECERGLETITTTGDKVTDFIAEFNVNLNEVDLNNFIMQPSLLGSEPEEEEQEIPEGEHRYFVYAWRWCGDEGFAKIGRTRNGLKGVENRMVTTYHPTDDPVLLGVRECADAEESHKTEQYILNGLERTRPDREWVEIDEKFNEMIDKSFMESQAD